MKQRNYVAYVVYVIIGLALVGIMSQLFNAPGDFFKSLLSMLLIGLIVFGIFYFLFYKNRPASSDMRKYKQALKQSNRKYAGNHHAYSKSVNKIALRKKKKSVPHLRVIDGQKSKRKNRANF